MRLEKNLPSFAWVTVVAYVAFTIGFSSEAGAEEIFSDSFESGGFYETSEDFLWRGQGGGSRVFVARDDGYIVNGPLLGGPFPEREYENAPLNSGSHAMVFRYRAADDPDASSDDKRWAEKRFQLTEGGRSFDEIWLRYWIRVPINFDVSTRALGSTDNYKWFALWMDGYSNRGTGATVVWNFWRRDDGSVRFTFSTSNDTLGSGHHSRYDNFITAGDRGRWMQVVLYAKRSSSRDATDGEIGFWRRWEDETEFTQIAFANDRGIVPPQEGPQGFQAGYVLGYANPGYAKETEWLVDDFTVATSSLLDVLPSPRPPEKVVVE